MDDIREQRRSRGAFGVEGDVGRYCTDLSPRRDGRRRSLRMTVDGQVHRSTGRAPTADGRGLRLQRSLEVVGGCPVAQGVNRSPTGKPQVERYSTIPTYGIATTTSSSSGMMVRIPYGPAPPRSLQNRLVTWIVGAAPRDLGCSSRVLPNAHFGYGHFVGTNDALLPTRDSLGQRHTTFGCSSRG